MRLLDTSYIYAIFSPHIFFRPHSRLILHILPETLVAGRSAHESRPVVLEKASNCNPPGRQILKRSRPSSLEGLVDSWSSQQTFVGQALSTQRLITQEKQKRGEHTDYRLKQKRTLAIMSGAQMSPPKPWSRPAAEQQQSSPAVPPNGAPYAPISRPYAVGPMYGGIYEGAFGGFLQPQMVALSNLHYAIGSVAAITDLVSANASAIWHACVGALKLVEDVGQAAGEAVGVLRAHSSSTNVILVGGRRRIARRFLGGAALLVALLVLSVFVRGRQAGHPSSSSIDRLRSIAAVLALLGGVYAGHHAAGALAASQAALEERNLSSSSR
jgi:hypothetical protein